MSLMLTTSDMLERLLDLQLCIYQQYYSATGDTEELKNAKKYWKQHLKFETLKQVDNR